MSDLEDKFERVMAGLVGSVMTGGGLMIEYSVYKYLSEYIKPGGSYEVPGFTTTDVMLLALVGGQH